MTKIQFIERDGKREFAILPIELFEAMTGYLEEWEDEALYDAAKAEDDGFRIPSAVTEALLNGGNPVRAWREHRGLTQETLAAQAGISKAFLCQIETGKRTGAVKTLKSIADALGITLDDVRG
ncbi:MAG: helix-turn-helix domain-containing protein [Candidatus Accumulibacter sp.]|jgi:DNA-binding XRE family transcriptional regulator|nr:helix-turn-helix domain-containing protein [Accumulibacter sp.]